jgi:UDP-N-acetylmuramoyl-L-alanyl-D-glutamate--2,6-diaminopimelate ligase
MRLRDLLQALPGYEFEGDPEVDVRLIEFDSRRVGGGELFVCLEGLARNGHDFAATAVARGAVALVVTHLLADLSQVPQVVVADTREAMARLAAAFFSYPARSLKVIGVTGTNGKTTVTHLIHAVVKESGDPVEIMGTLGTRVGETYASTGFTTPESTDLQRLLRESVDRGTSWVAMEVSSHALTQKRTFATDFHAVVFTNLTQDHLDYHGDMNRYLAAKELLFDVESRGTDGDVVAVINADDPAGTRIAGKTRDRVVTYGTGPGVDYRARHARTHDRGTHYELVTPEGSTDVELPLMGDFNVLNALAAQAAAMELGLSLETAARGVEAIPSISGRMEVVRGDQPFLVVVDFAHTPDALERALRSAREFTAGKLTVVFGCGGDRDREKRPRMGAVAGELADRVMVTSDNPRHENPSSIIDEILVGVSGGIEVIREEDRTLAIRAALEQARKGDTILLAGKGHETVQVMGDTSIPFDDRRVAAEVLKEIGFDVDDNNQVV